MILACVLSLEAASVRPAWAAAAAPAEAITRASLAIDTNDAGPSGPIIHERLDELGNRQLRRAEVLPGRGASDPWIRLTVRALPGEEPGYTIASGVYVGGQPIAESVHTTECRLCTEGEAVERGTAEVERLVPFIRDHAEVRRAAQAKADAPPPVVKEEVPTTRPLGARGKAGIGLLAVGGVGVGLGLGLTLKPARPDPAMPLEEITTRPVGLAVLGIGAAALIAGAVLLALDRKAPPRRVTWVPSAGRGSAGFVLFGSF